MSLLRNFNCPTYVLAKLTPPTIVVPTVTAGKLVFIEHTEIYKGNGLLFIINRPVAKK